MQSCPSPENDYNACTDHNDNDYDDSADDYDHNTADHNDDCVADHNNNICAGDDYNNHSPANNNDQCSRCCSIEDPTTTGSTHQLHRLTGPLIEQARWGLLVKHPLFSYRRCRRVDVKHYAMPAQRCGGDPCCT